MILVPDLADIERTTTSDAERRVARLLRGIEGPATPSRFTPSSYGAMPSNNRRRRTSSFSGTAS
ncbi:hypothetical protein ACU686_20860 [Yinghuangia aomiensis]